MVCCIIDVDISISSSGAAVEHCAKMEVTISGIIANLSMTDIYNTGVGIATVWTYPSVVDDLIPLPLTRFTTFTDATGDTSIAKYKKAVVTAKVSRGPYGTMKAILLEVTQVIEK